jgi:hypothetical protein
MEFFLAQKVSMMKHANMPNAQPLDRLESAEPLPVTDDPLFKKLHNLTRFAQESPDPRLRASAARWERVLKRELARKPRRKRPRVSKEAKAAA